MEWWNALPQEFRPRVLAYLYRLWPIIQRTPGYIDKMSDPPASKEEILRQWGTGEYEIRLTDLDKPRDANFCRARFKFSEPITEFEPVVEVTELDMGRKENASFIAYLRSKGKLKMPDAQPQPAAANDTAAVSALAAGFRDLLGEVRASRATGNSTESTYAKISEMFQSANKTVLEMVMGQFKQNSPKDFIDIMLAMQKLQPAPASDPRIDFLQAELLEERKSNRELMTRLLDQHKDGGIEKTLTILSSVRNFFGDGGRGRSNKWLEVAEVFQPQIDHTLSILDKFATGFSFSRGRGNPGARQPHGNRPATAPAGLPGAQPGAAEAPTTSQNEDPMQMQLFAFIEQIWAPMTNFLAQGRSGEEFGDFLATGFGMTVIDHGQIKAIGRDRILTLLKMTPSWSSLAPIEAQFVKFLDEFLAWEPLGPDAPDEPPPPPTRIAKAA